MAARAGWPAGDGRVDGRDGGARAIGRVGLRWPGRGGRAGGRAPVLPGGSTARPLGPWDGYSKATTDSAQAGDRASCRLASATSIRSRSNTSDPSRTYRRREAGSTAYETGLAASFNWRLCSDVRVTVMARL